MTGRCRDCSNSDFCQYFGDGSFWGRLYLERVHTQWPGCGFVVTRPLTTKYWVLTNVTHYRNTRARAFNLTQFTISPLPLSYSDHHWNALTALICHLSFIRHTAYMNCCRLQGREDLDVELKKYWPISLDSHGVQIGRGRGGSWALSGSDTLTVASWP